MPKQFSYKPAEIQADHYVLGGVGDSVIPKIILSPTGQWTPPPFEAQSKNGIETYSCTGYNTLGCIEVLAKLQGFDFDLSERFMGIVAGTDPKVGGNDPHTVAEALRHYGAIAEGDLPFDDTIKTVEEFYSFKGNDERTCRDAGEVFTEAWTFMHTWVFNGFVGNKQELLKECLQYSPIGVSVDAWKREGIDGTQGLYDKEKGTRDNHWTKVIGYKEGEYWIVDDSYLEDGTPIKYLRWDYDFGCAKRYHFVKNPVWKKPTWYQTFLTGVLKLLGLK